MRCNRQKKAFSVPKNKAASNEGGEGAKQLSWVQQGVTKHMLGSCEKQNIFFLKETLVFLQNRYLSLATLPSGKNVVHVPSVVKLHERAAEIPSSSEICTQ